MKNNKKLIPELRFPEFENEGEWEIKTLSGICDITNGKANAQDHVDNGRYPLFDRSEVIKASDEFIFDCEAVIIPGEGMRFIPKYYEGKFNLHQRAYALKDFSCSGQFVYYSMLHRSTLLSQKAVQSTVLSLRLPILQDFPIEIPKKPEEQQKIASCLSSLDEVIEVHSQKLELLKEHKKGLLQNLFPQEGEKVPKVRFKEFEKDGVWVEKKLEKVAEVITGNTPSTNQPEYYNGEIMFVSPADINDNRYITQTKTTLTELGFSKTRHIKANSILFVCIGSTIGKIAQNKFECATNQQINSLIPFKEYSSDFLYSALENSASQISELAGIQAVPIINKAQFSSVKLFFPTIQEQQKIASCLSSLDELITAQTEKIEQLKQHKKGLMQGLFPK